MVKVKEDLTGWVMCEHGVPDSRLTVIKQAEDHILPDGKRVAQWLCECNCEERTQIITTGKALKSGNTKSCGCLHRERTIMSNKKYNKYDLSGEYGIGWTSNTNNEFYFDIVDYDKIKDICWCECTSGGIQRLVGKTTDDKQLIAMHILLGYNGYDHIDRNELNNRRCNLRKCTASQNVMNRNKLKNNTSGFTGVGWNKTRQKWRARVMINKKEHTLGFYDDKEDAIRARLEAEAKYYGEFSPQRHLFKEYNIIEIENNTKLME